jgi:hypothetical protein
VAPTPRPSASQHYPPTLGWPTCRNHLRLRINEQRPCMSPWLEEFLVRDFCTEGVTPIRLPQALCKVIALDPYGSDGLILDVIEACYRASTFKNKKNPHTQLTREILKEIPTVEHAIAALRSFLSRYPEAGSWMLCGAYLRWKEVHKPKKVQYLGVENTRVTLAHLQEEFFQCWADTLKRPIPGVKSGPFLHRFQSGPLLYQQPLDEQDKPPLDPALNGLAFQLAFLFRRATSKQVISWATGSSMPTTGKPHYPIVTLLAKCALPDRHHITSSLIRDRIAHLVKKKVTLASWPTN